MAIGGANNQGQAEQQQEEATTPNPNQNQTQAAAAGPPVRDWRLFLQVWVKFVAPMVDIASFAVTGVFYSYTDPETYPGSFYDLELVRGVTIGIFAILFMCLLADVLFYLMGRNAAKVVDKRGTCCWLFPHAICLILSCIHLTFVQLYIYNPVALNRYNLTSDLMVAYKDKDAPPIQKNCAYIVKIGKSLVCAEVLPEPYQCAGFLLWFGLLSLVIRLGNILFVSLMGNVTWVGSPQTSAAPAQNASSWSGGLFRQRSQSPPRPQSGQSQLPPPVQQQGPSAQSSAQPPTPSGPQQNPMKPAPAPLHSTSVDPPQPQRMSPKDLQFPSAIRSPYSPSYPPPPAEPAPQSCSADAKRSAASKISFTNTLMSV